MITCVPYRQIRSTRNNGNSLDEPPAWSLFPELANYNALTCYAV